MTVNNITTPVAEVIEINNSEFLTASNAKPMQLVEIENTHIIPVFTRDNMPTISQADFIGTVLLIAGEKFGKQTSLDIKTSHPIKGRTFDARYKAAKELLPHEKTLYYERMTFLAQYPIKKEVNGKEVHLVIGGIKAYNKDNLNTTSDRTGQRFQLAIGFKVQVCTNLCINTEGAYLDIKVKSLDELEKKVSELIENYSAENQIERIAKMNEYRLTEQQFANIIGRARIQQYLPAASLKELPELIIQDSQLNAVSKAYLRDKNFKNDGNGITMWNFYNLLTDSVKSSYIDNFLEREVNAFALSEGLMEALEIGEESKYNWFLN